MKYAADTEVPVDRSRAEIERTLTKFGADQFGYASEQGYATIGFRANGRLIRFDLPLAQRGNMTERQHAQAIRSAWRALALSIKAKVVAVDSGIVSFEQEFMPFTVMPDGKTVAQHALPAITAAYQGREQPRLLPHFGS